MRVKTVILFVTISISFSASAQWTQQNSGSSNNLFSIQFPSVTTGYFCSNNGYISKTTNGGNNWNQVAGPLSGDHLFFSSIDTGYVFGAYSILKTVNGGANWATKMTSTVDNIVGLHFPTSNTGYAFAYNLNTTQDTFSVYKTTDAGQSWIKVFKMLDYHLPTAIFFTDANTGYFTSQATNTSGEIYRTTDGGITWTKQLNAIYGINWIHFPSKTIGYVVGYTGLIYKSTDGGITWVQKPNSNATPLYSVYFTHIDSGFAVGGNGFSSGSILRTVDGGQNWTLSQSSVNTYQSVYFVNGSSGYVCGSNGTVLKYSGIAGINDEFSAVQFSLYPNPATNKLTVELSDAISAKDLSLSIYDALGKQCTRLMLEATKQEIDISFLPKGIYFLQITSSERIVSKRFVKQ